MVKNLRNLVNQKPSEVQQGRENTIKHSQNKKKKTKEPTPEQLPGILEDKDSWIKKETSSAGKNEAESTIILSQSNPKRKCQDEANL